MAAIFIAEALNSLLKQWEDINLAREAGFQYNLFYPDDNFLPPFVGSELNSVGMLTRSIPDYKMLRKVLGGVPFSHPTNFLPRIPKHNRQAFTDIDDYFDHNHVFPNAKIPIFLLKWLETRRACVVEDTVPIPCVDLSKENWLDKLPYHSFYLRIHSPIVFEIETALNLIGKEQKEWSIADFIVYDDGECIQIMCWAKENNQLHLTKNEEQDLQQFISDLKNNKVKSLAKTVLHIDKKADIFTRASSLITYVLSIKKGTSLLKVVLPGSNSPEYIDVNDSDMFDDNDVLNMDPKYMEYLEIMRKNKVLVELINGFCKLMSELPKSASIVSIDSLETPPLPKIPTAWFELKAQTIDYLETSRENSVVTIRRSIGSEKSPHVRRAHCRRYVQPNGTIKEVWIEEVIVREDKLVNEQLQGGAIVVKHEE
jgi:hypothetical protein